MHLRFGMEQKETQSGRVKRSLWLLVVVIAAMGLLQQLQARKQEKGATPKAVESSEANPASLPSATANSAPSPAALTGVPKSYPFTFAAYGDIRFTDPSNHSATDPERRHAIIAQIAKDKPDFVVINGDIVLDGGVANDWKVMDEETRPLHDAGVKIVPALGNHDVRGGAPALARYFERFPEVKPQRWYSLKYGNCLFLILDSDAAHAPGTPQGDWIANQLDHVSQDVDFVILAMHHPPYTKSSENFMGMGGHSARLEEQQLAQLLELKQKTLRAKIIAIAGHVHNYERYEDAGVMYIVSGGGGATPYMIKRGPDDFYREPGPTYHYCTFKVDHGKLSFEMHKLEMPQGEAKWSVEDKFEKSSY